MTRATLARAQATLVRALVADGEPPPGFNAARVEALRRSSREKRLREAMHGWGGLARGLGARGPELFARYAAGHPLPEEGGPLADGFGFARFVSQVEPVPVELLRRLAWTLLFYRETPRGLLPRRWALASVWVRGCGGSWAVGIRLPGGVVAVTARVAGSSVPGEVGAAKAAPESPPVARPS